MVEIENFITEIGKKYRTSFKKFENIIEKKKNGKNRNIKKLGESCKKFEKIE